jgi:hypothetical protein
MDEVRLRPAHGCMGKVMTLVFHVQLRLQVKEGSLTQLAI